MDNRCAMKWTQALLLAVTCTSLNAFALDCNAPPGGIGPDSSEASLHCAENEFSAADRSLNDAYRKVVGRLRNAPDSDQALRTQIVAAQRAWITFRDAECDFRASLAGSAPQWLPVNRTECLTELTHARLKVINGYLEQLQ
jgi:uncharacterized protein YecT (DUF1311 family)